jgi:hypothetical protein
MIYEPRLLFEQLYRAQLDEIAHEYHGDLYSAERDYYEAKYNAERQRQRRFSDLQLEYYSH